MRQRDAADGTSALDAFWSEVGAVVSEDLINEVPGADGHPGREVTNPEAENFWEAQASSPSQFRTDSVPIDGLFIAVAGDPGGGGAIQTVLHGIGAPSSRFFRERVIAVSEGCGQIFGSGMDQKKSIQLEMDDANQGSISARSDDQFLDDRAGWQLHGQQDAGGNVFGLHHAGTGGLIGNNRSTIQERGVDVAGENAYGPNSTGALFGIDGLG